MDRASQRPFKREVIRKLLHLPAFAFPLIAFISAPVAVGMLVVLAIGYGAAILAEQRRGYRVPLISSIISYCRRDGGYDWGPFYLACGMGIVIALAKPMQALYAAYVIAISDGMASLIGMRFGSHLWGTLKKSYVGSLSFLVTCFLGGLLFFSPLHAAIAAAVLTAVEMISTRGLDNLTLPIGAFVMLMILA